MNILLINHYAGSPELGMEFRPYYLAKKWTEQGHHVTIITSSYSHYRKNNPEIKKNFYEQEIDGIKYLWIKTNKYKANGLGRFINIFAFILKIFFNHKKILKTYKPDIIIASSTYPFDNYVAHKMAKKSKIPFIYEVHDLWPLSPIELGGMSPKHPFILLTQAAENFAYRHCDATVSILPLTKEYMVSHGLSPEKWFYVPNGICLDEIKQNEEIPQQHKQILEKLKKEGKTIVGYTGNHGIPNALDTIIEAAKKTQNSNITFVLAGSGTEKASLIKQVEKLNLKNVIFLDPVKKTQVQSLLSYFDILYVGLKSQPLFRFGVSPNKIFDYMYAAKPVIMAIKAGNDIIKEAGCGITIEPESPNEINKAIEKIMALSQEERDKMGQNGRRYVLENHTYEILSQQFTNIITSVL